MRHPLRRVAWLAGALLLTGGRPTQEPPTDWIDPATGHRVIRLSAEPGSQTLYFHDNAYSPEGDRFVFNGPRGIMLVDLTTLGAGREPPRADLAVPGSRGAYMARRSREVYFTRGGGRAAPPRRSTRTTTTRRSRGACRTRRAR